MIGVCVWCASKRAAGLGRARLGRERGRSVASEEDVASRCARRLPSPGRTSSHVQNERHALAAKVRVAARAASNQQSALPAGHSLFDSVYTHSDLLVGRHRVTTLCLSVLPSKRGRGRPLSAGCVAQNGRKRTSSVKLASSLSLAPSPSMPGSCWGCCAAAAARLKAATTSTHECPVSAEGSAEPVALSLSFLLYKGEQQAPRRRMVHVLRRHEQAGAG